MKEGEQRLQEHWQQIQSSYFLMNLLRELIQLQLKKFKIIFQLKNKNIGVLITDHNVQETLAITDRTYLMFEGSILKDGKPEDLAKDKVVRKVYLGQNFIFRKNRFENI